MFFNIFNCFRIVFFFLFCFVKASINQPILVESMCCSLCCNYTVAIVYRLKIIKMFPPLLYEIIDFTILIVVLFDFYNHCIDRIAFRRETVKINILMVLSWKPQQLNFDSTHKTRLRLYLMHFTIVLIIKYEITEEVMEYWDKN